jgi:ethanolamine utilization protein EutA (predicted chaperonin)
LEGYSDANWANCRDTRRSTSGILVLLGNTPIIWKSKLQSTVALSTCEAELVALTKTTTEIMGIRFFLDSLQIPIKNIPEIHCDNMSTVLVAKNPMKHSELKHVALKEFFVRERQESGDISVVKVNTEDNLSDIFTKPLPQSIFFKLRDKLLVN